MLGQLARLGWIGWLICALGAVLLGLLVTWFGFPHKHEELEVEAEYAKEQ